MKTFILLPFAFILTASLLRAEEPPLVRISAYERTSAEEPVNVSLGFVVEKEGVLLTAYNTLIDRSTSLLLPRIEAQLQGTHGKTWGAPQPASIIAVEPTLNFAVLKIDANGLPVSKIAPREEIVKDLAVRAPAPDHLNFAPGIITALNSMECYQESITATMLQAKIDIPDSALGGPIFNEKGEVVAVHVGYSPAVEEDPDTHDGEEMEEGVIHVLPIFLVFNIYEAIKLKKNFKSPWTGFSVRPLTETEGEKFPVGRFLGGLGIDHVWKNSPAEELGILENDMLVGFSYYPTRDPAAFQKWLYMYGVGEKVKLHLLRSDATPYTVEYTIEERPKWAVPK